MDIVWHPDGQAENNPQPKHPEEGLVSSLRVWELSLEQGFLAKRQGACRERARPQFSQAITLSTEDFTHGSHIGSHID